MALFYVQRNANMLMGYIYIYAYTNVFTTPEQYMFLCKVRDADSRHFFEFRSDLFFSTTRRDQLTQSRL